MPTSPAAPALDFKAEGLKNVSDSDLLRAYWVYTFVARPWLVSMGSKLGAWSVNNLAPARWAVSKTIFAQFCGGESVEQCRPTLHHLAEKRIHTILDYSVEGAETEASFDHTTEEIARTIREAAQSPDIAFSVFKVTGLGRSAAIEVASRDLSTALSDPETIRIAQRVDHLCRLAHQLGVRIFIDAEETWLQPFIDYLAVEAMKAFNQQRPIVFNTYQLYLQDGLNRLKVQSDEVFATGGHFGAKLVRGAYMEKEAARAAAEGRPDPINPTKQATDDLYNATARYCLDRLERTAFCLGTHNAESCTLMTQWMSERGIPNNDARIWFAQLLGMSDILSYPLADAGYNVAKYVPYGPVKAVVPYLIRRAQENTTVAGQSGRELQLIEAEVKRRHLNTYHFFF